jgi:hypothetical protein
MHGRLMTAHSDPRPGKRIGARTSAWLLLAVAAGLALQLEPALADRSRQFTFSWPFTDADGMRPRGGTTRGTPVELAEEPSEAWRALQEPGLSKFERDRRAILAMAGGYRTTFDFIETVGFTEGYEPARPYQSWGTEYIYVVEDQGDLIRLQHLMVMFFEDEQGRAQGPFVQKHWRQDWRYEDTDLHVFAGHDRWRRRALDAQAVAGRWSQAVFQVDDSPRYEAVGEWRHEGNYSAWTSERTLRPLPRRESSVRDDYDVLSGTNRHTITPTGWVQEEENLKLVLDAAGHAADGTPYLARELGVNRYEHVVDFDFSAGDRYWQRTAEFWRDVRDAWDRIYAQRDELELAERVDGRALFERMFDYAGRLDSGEDYDPQQSRRFVRETLDLYVQ